MGMSTDAKLVYGVDLNSDCDEGLPEWLKRPDGVSAEDWDDDPMCALEDVGILDEWSPWHGGNLHYHSYGHCDCSCRCVGFAIASSNWSASEVPSFDVPEDADERIHKFLVAVGAPQEMIDKGAVWLLLPYYG